MNKNLSIDNTYSKLVSSLKKEIKEGLYRAQDAYDKEKIITYWKIGQSIHKHFLENKIRAEFGKQIYKNLSTDLHIHERNLYHMTEFFKAYPVFEPSINLKWSHYRLLSTVKDESKRQELETKVSEEKLSKRNLEVFVKEIKKDFPKVTPKISNLKKLRPIRGKSFHYKIFKNKFSYNYFVDYGFRIYKETNIKNFSGSFAKGMKKGNDFSYIPVNVQRKYIFTYQAFVTDVIDADTIWVIVDLGFRAWTKQKIRLRGIDAPEKGTKDFEKSKQFLIDKFKNVQFLMIKSFYPDLYDRWLSDIFYIPNEKDPKKVLERGTYLNQELLDLGIVRRFEKNRNKLH